MSQTELNLPLSQSYRKFFVWLRRFDNWLLVLLIVVSLVPIWGFPYFPSNDGPAHLENANIIRLYHAPQYSAFRKYYLLNKQCVTNWFTHLILSGLLCIFPILIAEKLFLTGYVIALPVSARYALNVIQPEAGILACLSIPFIFNSSFHMGFYAFVYSLPVYFVTLGYWLKHRENFKLPHISILMILSLILYLCHVVSLVMCYVAIIMIIIADTCANILKHARVTAGTLLDVLKGKIGPVLIAILPVIILFAYSVSQPSRGLHMTYVIPLATRVWNLCSIDPLSSYGPALSTRLPLAFLFMVISIYCIWKIDNTPKEDAVNNNHKIEFFILILAYVFICMIAPDKISHGSYINIRLTLYPFFGLLLFWGSFTYGKMAIKTIAVITALVVVVCSGYYSIKYAEMDRYLAEYVSGMELIAPNSTILPLTFSTTDGKFLLHMVNPFDHASGLIAAERHVVNFANYEAYMGYFPTLWRPNLNPERYIGEFMHVPPNGTLSDYAIETTGYIDYVLIWGLCSNYNLSSASKRILGQLSKNYHLIFISNGGMLRIYKNNTFNRLIIRRYH